MNAPLHPSRLAPVAKNPSSLGSTVLKVGDFRIEAVAYADGALSLWSANTGKVISLELEGDQLSALIDIAQKAKQASAGPVATKDEKSKTVAAEKKPALAATQETKPPLPTEPAKPAEDFTRKQVRQDDGAWCVTLVPADPTKKSLNFFYKSRSQARAATPAHRVGEAGRLK